MLFAKSLCAFLLSASPMVHKDVEVFKGFMPIRSAKSEKTREVFVHWHKAPPGAPTVVLLNGLTYSTKQWQEFTDVLVAQGLGVLRYDMAGQGQTLLKYGPVFRSIPLEEQVEDLHALLDQAKITSRIDLVGLSYGGGVAMAFGAKYPERTKNLIVMAPYTEPLSDQDEWIKSQIWATRQMFPYNKASDDELYDFFLKQIVYSTYPSVEPIVLEHPYKLEATFRMTQGIRKWKSAQALPDIPAGSLHLMIAGSDQYIKRKVLEDFWALVPEAKRGSQILVNNSEHKMPEDIPFFSASWVAEIVKQNEVIKEGRQFEADPYTGSVRYDGGKINFPRESDGKGTLGGR